MRVVKNNIFDIRLFVFENEPLDKKPGLILKRGRFGRRNNKKLAGIAPGDLLVLYVLITDSLKSKKSNQVAGFFCV